MAYKLSTTARNAACDAVTAKINVSAPGTLKIYTGAQPANPQTAVTGTLLATLTFSTTSFGAAVAGVATANAITEDSSADATNTAGYARIADGAGAAVMDLSVTATGGGGDVQLNTVSIVAGGPVRCSSMTYTIPES